MYRQHWGLSSSPFQRSVAAQRLLDSPPHDESLARLHFLVENGWRLGLLVGPPGSGKSQVLAVFGEALRRRGVEVVRINLRGLDTRRFLWEVAAGLKTNPAPDDSTFTLWRRIDDQLIANRYQQLTSVFLFDDAFRAEGLLLDQILRVMACDPSSEARVTVVMSGLEAQMPLLSHEMLEAAELRVDLEPWDQQQLNQYVADEISHAGGNRETFTAQALTRLFQLSGGLPRRVNHLAELSLLAGAGQGLSHIEAETLETVYEELGVELLATK